MSIPRPRGREFLRVGELPISPRCGIVQIPRLRGISSLHTHLNVSKSVGVVYCKKLSMLCVCPCTLWHNPGKSTDDSIIGQACRKSQLLVKAGLELINTTVF